MNPRLRLRPTMLSDLDFVTAVERDSRNLPFITPWERTQHEGAVRFPDFRHFIVEGGEDDGAVGFVNDSPRGTSSTTMGVNSSDGTFREISPLAAASRATSEKIFFSASLSLFHTCGATCVVRPSTMWPVSMMCFCTS